MSRAELESLVSLLGRVHQLPTKARTGPGAALGERWPWPRYVLRGGREAVAEAAEELKMDLVAPADAPPPTGLAWFAAALGFGGGAAPVAAGAPPRPLTPREVRRLVLHSRAICAWGECFEGHGAR